MPDMPDIWAGVWGGGGPPAAGTCSAQDRHASSGWGKAPLAVYELGGPPFTMDDVAGAVSGATGTCLEYRNVSPGELRDILIRREPTPLARVIAAAA